MLAADVAVVGAGVFGVTAALELAQRGARVQLIDPGPLPHPDAASTDISKVVRLDYGADEFYLRLMEQALAGWRNLNDGWPRPLFHETGFAVLCSQPMQAGSFEGDSYELLSRYGHPLERLADGAALARLPPLSGAQYLDGYINPQGGWVQSGAVMTALVEQAIERGVIVTQAQVASLDVQHDRALGVICQNGDRLAAGTVVIAAGAWTPLLLPSLSRQLRSVGQPVLMFTPAEPTPFQPPAFMPWAADIGTTGWYGFCANRQGVVKVANHGPGVALSASAPRCIPEGSEAQFRAFLARSFAALAAAPLTATRLCLYCDSFDGDFLIAPHPHIANLVIAAGGSGHAFKMAPILGPICADAIQGRDHPALARFGWRDPATPRREGARAI